MEDKLQFRSNIQAIAWIKRQCALHGIPGFARLYKVEASRIRWVVGHADYIPPKLAEELGIEIIYKRKDGWR